MAVDWLRSCYSSIFKYSVDPPLTLVGKYSFASPNAEMLPSPNPYASSTWLKEWEVSDGLGDSLEDSSWSNGVPLDPGIKDTSKEVLVLRTDCGSPYDNAYVMSGLVSDGVPSACWRVPPERHGPFTYRLLVPRLVYDAGSGPVTFSCDLLLSWGVGFGFEWLALDGDVIVALFPLAVYPGGNNFFLELVMGGGADPPICGWVSLLGTDQGNTIITLLPESFVAGLTVLEMDPVSLLFVSAPDDSFANPADIFPL